MVYCLSLLLLFAPQPRWDDGVKHIMIDRAENLYSFPGYPSFASLAELIQYHTEQDDQLQVKDTFVVLKRPISPFGYKETR